MKPITILFIFIISICDGYSLGTEPEKSTSDESKIYLPTAAIITGYLKDWNSVNVILLGSVDSGKSNFVEILNDKNKSFFPQTMDMSFITYSLTGNVNFHIYDLINQETSNNKMDAYLRVATVMLIFDKQEQFINQCKINKVIDATNSQVLPLYYYNNSYHFLSTESLNNYTPFNAINGPFNNYYAHLFSLNLFIELEKEIQQMANKKYLSQCVIF